MMIMTIHADSPEKFIIDEKHFSLNHAEHWNILTQESTQITQCIHDALDKPVSPMGLCPDEVSMNPCFWLIQGEGASTEIVCNQVHAVKDNKPLQLKHAFPSFCSPYAFPVTIKHITTSPAQSQAVLCLSLADKSNTDIYAFDILYTVNQAFYREQQCYQAYFNAWAYRLESIPEHETVLIDDPEAIRHHRALNDILAQHQGQTPDNLQDLIQAWQPQSEDDKQPILVDISKTIAYLYGDNLGQEDEAWFQGRIVGKTQTHFLNHTYSLYDIVFVEEVNQPAILMRVASQQHEFEIGQYIRGDIWLQVNIFSTT